VRSRAINGNGKDLRGTAARWSHWDSDRNRLGARYGWAIARAQAETGAPLGLLDVDVVGVWELAVDLPRHVGAQGDESDLPATKAPTYITGEVIDVDGGTCFA
jgi:hypothetical protein